MRAVFYDSEKDNKPKSADLSWEVLRDEYLSVFEERENKGGPAWSPVALQENAKRASKNVESITCAVFDLDDVSQDQLDACTENLDNVACVLHSTHGYGGWGSELGRYRLVFPFKDAFEKAGRSESAFKAAWINVRTAIIEKFKIPADPSCKDLARLYFLPSFPPSLPSAELDAADAGAEVFLELGQGDFLDWRDFANTTPATPPTAVEHDPISNVVDLSEARKVLASTRKAESKELLRKILDGEPLSERGARDDTLNRAIAIIHWRLPQLPKAAVLELLRPSIAAMLPEEGVESWERLAADKFDRSVESRGLKLEDDAKEKAELVREFSVLQALAPNAPTPTNWQELLSMVEDTAGNRHLRNTVANAALVLTYHPKWRNTFRFNLVTNQFEYTGEAIDKRLSAESLPVVIAQHLDTYAERGMELRISSRQIWETVLSIAELNAYDPVADHLNGLVWDGVSRLDNMAFEFLNATRIDDEGQDISEHVSRVVRRWMISAVARGLNPGCQVDTTLVLESPQGYGKSTAFKVLGGKWFSEAPLTAGEKDTALIVAQNWIVELAELDHMSRSKLSTVKAFLTAKTDEYRAPYARATIKHARRCVFGGTINPDPGGYFTEDENRRFWPIKVGRIDPVKLEKAAPQLMAEAVSLYKAGFTCSVCLEQGIRCKDHRWWLDEAEALIAEAQTRQRTQTDDMLDSFLSGWQSRPLDRRPRYFNTTEALEIAGYSKERVNRGQQIEMGKALKELKLERAPRVHGTTRRYLAGEKLSKLPYLKPNHNYQIETAKTYEN